MAFIPDLYTATRKQNEEKARREGRVAKAPETPKVASPRDDENYVAPAAKTKGTLEEQEQKLIELINAYLEKQLGS